MNLIKTIKNKSGDSKEDISSFSKLILIAETKKMSSRVS
jgi:hypothetical protein